MDSWAVLSRTTLGFPEIFVTDMFLVVSFLCDCIAAFHAVPILVKIAAINKILVLAKKMRRVLISPKKMLIKVAAVVVVVAIYLTVWTILDRPREQEYLTLESERSQVVLISLACSSHGHEFWYMITLGWQVLLLVMASVLAFQSRKVVQEFNESRSLGTMVYSHFLFIILVSATLHVVVFLDLRHYPSPLPLFAPLICNATELTPCLIA